MLATFRPTDVAKLIGFAALYVLVATVVLRLFAANGIVSIVWPPSGLAVAVLLLGGKKYAPAIWLGAWIANLLASGSPAISAIIALGNTLEALTAFWLITRHSDFDRDLRELRDLLRLIFLGALSAATVSALTGSITLLAFGLINTRGLADQSGALVDG